MKKTIILLVTAITFSISIFAQKPEVKDTDTCHVIMTVAELKQLLQIVNANIDSKTITKQVVDFLQQRAVLQPAKKEEVKSKN